MSTKEYAGNPYTCQECGTITLEGHEDHLNGIALNHLDAAVRDEAERIQRAAKTSVSAAYAEAGTAARKWLAYYGYSVGVVKVRSFSKYLVLESCKYGRFHEDGNGIARWTGAQ